ncbi:vegetative cell wall protein gp1-like [Pararge aegeria]|uniref:vegetative cell wall protein gp1-like n=1 Tax=Pararge aegeria TaxID=116150 RepID=UPI0019D07EBC|nr:vegetative cell wall protein gp1-like [Pararge aegeria]
MSELKGRIVNKQGIQSHIHDCALLNPLNPCHRSTNRVSSPIFMTVYTKLLFLNPLYSSEKPTDRSCSAAVECTRMHRRSVPPQFGFARLPPNPPPLPQRRATRPRAIRRVFVQNTTAALEVGLDAIIATGQATLATRNTKAHGAGPSTPAPSRQATPTPFPTTADVPPNPGTRTTAAASVVMQTRPAAPVPSPRSPRFTAAQADIAVGRFPSPPQRGPRIPAAFTPPNMSALSPSSPMDASASPSPTYAAQTPAPTIDIGGAPKTAAKYPPLIVEALPDWPHHFRELKRLLGHRPNGRRLF